MHSNVSEARGKCGKYFINSRWRHPVHHVFLPVLSDHERIWNNYIEIQWKSMLVILWWTQAYNSLSELARQHGVWRKTALHYEVWSTYVSADRSFFAMNSQKEYSLVFLNPAWSADLGQIIHFCISNQFNNILIPYFAGLKKHFCAFKYIILYAIRLYVI